MLRSGTCSSGFALATLQHDDTHQPKKQQNKTWTKERKSEERVAPQQTQVLYVNRADSVLGINCSVAIFRPA